MKTIFAPQYAPALFAFFERANLTFVDIGGRGDALGRLAPLAPVARYVTCEPDAPEARRLGTALAGNGWRDVAVIADAIAASGGDVTLYVTAAPGMSSLLEPDAAVASHFAIADSFRVERQTTVRTIPLDEAAATYAFTDACFLKVDTQGTELDILQSGAALVERSLVGVYVECLFRPFYKGQSLFADVDQFLRRQGFSLFTMIRSNLRRRGYRTDIYSERITTWAHCVYFREPDTLVADAARARRALPQLLALALAFDQFDLAFDVLAALQRLELLSGRELADVTADIEHVVTFATRGIIRRGARRGVPAEDLLGSNARDRRRIE